MKIIGLDVGRKITKGYDGETLDIYSSIVGESRIFKNGKALGKEDSILSRHYKGEQNEDIVITNFIGEIAKHESDYAAEFMSVTKVHEDTKILALTSISRLVKEADKLFVVIGQPIGNRSDKEVLAVEAEKEALKKLILGEHDVTINGTRKKFTVERVEVGAEGAVSALAFKKVPENYHHVIDIGSTTYNVATFRGKNWIELKSFTEYVGTETLANYNPFHMSRLIAANFYQRIRKQLGSITVIGGKAKDFEKPLGGYFKDVSVHEEHATVTAKGLYELGKLLRGETV